MSSGASEVRKTRQDAGEYSKNHVTYDINLSHSAVLMLLTPVGDNVEFTDVNESPWLTSLVRVS